MRACEPSPTSDALSPLPCWDAERRELRLGATVLKRFRQPAPNQTKLLEVFQEQGWGNSHLDDPLPRDLDEDDAEARLRLHDTIKRLNASLPPGTIHFRGDGTGEGVIWEYAAQQRRKRRRRH